MRALTLHAPVKQGRDWLLSVEISLGNDTFIVSAALSPETISWAKRMAQRKSQRLLELFSWVKDAIADRISLQGNWGKFGLLGKLARNVVQQMADSQVFMPDEEMSAAVQIYQLALDGHREANAFLQAKAGDSTMAAVRIAHDLLQRPDWYQRAVELCSLANAGDAGSRVVLEAVHAFRRPETEDDAYEPVAITYSLNSAISAPNGSSKRLAQYVNHYRLARLAPFEPDLDAFAGLLKRYSTIPDPLIGSYRRGSFYTDQDLMIRTGLSRW